ncbi:MAG TPA: hypothetical protein VK629_06205 [Steroidobacteraceae bacterium]|nr:hypothetical protein [Steroidobacteraceae bacterium]
MKLPPQARRLTVIVSVLAVAGVTAVLATDPIDTKAGTDWWSPNDARPFPALNLYRNANGFSTTLNAAGVTTTKGHPFFTPLGSNGRACITCHQPSDGMGLSVESIRLRWRESQGKDPLFAAIDGSNCPSQPQGDAASHSLLLNRGLFRVFRPWPPMDREGKRIEPQFTVEVVRDPTGCNTGKQYGLQSSTPTLSVYRRPRPVANIKYVVSMGFAFEPKNGLPLPIDWETGKQTSFNLLADARAFTLRDQARDAMRDHLQRSAPATASDLDRIVEFEQQLFSAQSHDALGGSVTAEGAKGGPEVLRDESAGDLQYAGSPVWKEFLPWKLAKEGSQEQQAFRASVARGADLFANRTFLVWDAAGITSMQFGNPVRNSCAFCHNMQHTGMDVAPGQVDLGTTNEPFAKPAPELPLFKLTCKDNFKPHPHLGRVIYTQDPGFALSTGRCVDIGKITIQQMRGLSSRAPYFSNGSAATLREIVDFYDQRYNIRFAEQEKQDLTNLMSVL